MSSFMIDDRTYNKMYELSTKAVQSGIVWLYPYNIKKEEANDKMYNLFKELQKANADTFEGEKVVYNEIKNKKYSFEEYDKLNTKELTQVYKNLQCILYQIEIEIDKTVSEFIKGFQVALADTIISKNLYYDNCEWGDFEF